MAGTLTISTLSDGTNSTSSTNCIQGSAKAWVNFNGTVATPGSIRSSYNVSSITRSATGVFDVVFTTPFSDVNYAVNATLGNVPNGTNTWVAYSQASQATTSCRISCNDNSASFNPTGVSVAVFR